MNPISKFQKLSEGLFVWQDFNPLCKTDCGSTAIQTPEGLVLIDPIRLENKAWDRLPGDGCVCAVLLTSGNHERDSCYEKERLGVPIYAPEEVQQELGADFAVRDGDRLFKSLQAIALPGAGPGETAYLASGVLVIGDALIHLDELAILPDKYCLDPQLLRRSLRVFCGLSFDRVCFAHGPPLLTHAKAQIERVIA